jgi:hypothetical protein
LRADLVLVLFVLAASTSAFGGKKAPKLAETIDLPPTFDVDYQFAAKQRAQLGPQREVPDDIAGHVGQEVFDSLVKSQMISGFRLPYTWSFRPYDSPSVNAFSLADGEVVAFTGLSRLIGTNRGLWAAVLAHEIAHVARRHAARRALFHEYIEEQVRYWQIRARMGDNGAVWAELAVRVAGNLAEKKLSRDLEHDADIQGMLLMARAGYHPDNAFAMHHLLRMNTPERSRIGTFFFSDHPRWESRDQRTERAYTDALTEYSRLWASPEASPGGTPPAVAFLGNTRGVENKGGSTGDLTLTLSCRNVGEPVVLLIHLTNGAGSPVHSIVGDYQDASGNMVIRERAVCADADSARPTIIHIPTAIIPAQDRKLRAQVDVLGARDEVLERSKVFDVPFPKTDRRAAATMAKVRVEPEPDVFPKVQEDGYKITKTNSPVATHTETEIAALPTRVEKPSIEVALSAVNPPAGQSGPHIPLGTTQTAVGAFPSALDSSGRPSNWTTQRAPSASSSWWQLSPAAEASPGISLSQSSTFFPVQPVGVESTPARVAIANRTKRVLTISAIRIAGSDASDFTQTNDCGHSVDAGATCTVSLTFTPTANGTRTAVLKVEGIAQEITLTGIGK